MDSYGDLMRILENSAKKKKKLSTAWCAEWRGKKHFCSNIALLSADIHHSLRLGFIIVCVCVCTVCVSVSMMVKCSYWWSNDWKEMCNCSITWKHTLPMPTLHLDKSGPSEANTLSGSDEHVIRGKEGIICPFGFFVHSVRCLLLLSICRQPGGNESVYRARPAICTTPGRTITADTSINKREQDEEMRRRERKGV